MATNNKLLLPSMMCADFGHLADDTAALVAAGADGLHLDLMDGTYVPNYGMGLQDIEWLCRNAGVPCDVHMMVENPGRYVDKFVRLGAKVVYVHPEADMHVARTLATISALGAKAGIAINPGTSFSAVEGILPLCDYVLVMTVNPGFAGQRWLHFVDSKISRLAKVGAEFGFKVIIDGNCSPEHIALGKGLGARGFVLGTAGLFGHGDYAKSMAKLRTI